MGEDFQRIEIGSKNFDATLLAFRRAYRLPKTSDLRNLATRLPQGSVVCSPSFIAGKSHLDSILELSAEYWVRGMFLARNKSIDLLMRLICQSQISKALEASGIDSCNNIALFGLVRDSADIVNSEKLLNELGGMRDDSLMDLNMNKIRFLLQFHLLPNWVEKEKIPQLLLEKSAILVFPS